MTRVDFVHFKAPGRRVPAWQVAEWTEGRWSFIREPGAKRGRYVDRLTPVWVER